MRRSPRRGRLCRSKAARKIEGRRKVLALLPLLLASTLCGALGAIAVNYFERRRDAAPSVTQQQPQPNVSTQAKTEPPPVAIAPELNAKNTEIQAPVQPENSSVTPADEPAPKTEAPKIAKREDADRKSAPPRRSETRTCSGRRQIGAQTKSATGKFRNSLETKSKNGRRPHRGSLHRSKSLSETTARTFTVKSSAFHSQ